MYKKDIRLIYREILGELYGSHKGLQAYTLYTRCSIEPEDILSFIDRYTKTGFINVIENGARIELTEEGRNGCGVEIQKLGNEAVFKSSNYLSSILRSPINVYSTYVPMKSISVKKNNVITPF